MSNTINIGGIEVSKFYLGGSSDVKIYLGTTKLYPHLQEPCFAVVDNISTYTARTYVDVFNESDGLWYKLNNLNQYEKYGVYGSGRTITYYNGKLTIDSGYEYQYSGGSWNNVGEVSGSSRVPDGYTGVEYIENTSQAYINLGVSPYSANGNSFTVETTFSSYTQSNLTYLISCEYTTSPYNGFVARWNRRSIELVGNSVGVDTTAENIPNGDGTSAITFHSDSTTTNNNNTPITLFSGLNRNSPWRYGKGRLYALKMTLNNSVVRELVPAKRDSDSKYGMYDLVTNTFYVSSNNYNFTGGSATGQIVYPMYYDEIQDPPNNLTFSSMTEAEAYECPWVGMHATINGDKYVFSGDSVSGYEWVYQPLPYDAEIQYLESSGTQYINTNAYVNTSNFEIGYKTDGANTFFGYCHENVGSGTWFGAEEGNMFYGTYSDTINMSSYLTSGENTIVCTKSGVTVNNTSISKTLSLGSDNISNIPLLFFSRWDFRTNAPEFRSLPCRYKSFYLKNNGELVVDMIPVRVGQVGYMYDRVSGELFGNVGSGSFILGPDK